MFKETIPTFKEVVKLYENLNEGTQNKQDVVQWSQQALELFYDLCAGNYNDDKELITEIWDLATTAISVLGIRKYKQQLVEEIENMLGRAKSMCSYKDDCDADPAVFLLQLKHFLNSNGITGFIVPTIHDLD